MRQGPFKQPLSLASPISFSTPRFSLLIHLTLILFVAGATSGVQLSSPFLLSFSFLPSFLRSQFFVSCATPRVLLNTPLVLSFALPASILLPLLCQALALSVVLASLFFELEKSPPLLF